MAQPSVHGRFVWQELLTADAAAAGAFYSRVIGWRTQPFPNPDSSYSIFLAQSGPVGGFSRLPADGREGGARSHWLPYIGADDVDATAAAAERLGGKALRPATNIENVGRYAVLADPQGAVFGIYKPQQARGSAAKSHPQPGEFAWQELASSDSEAAFKFYAELFGWEPLRRVEMGPSGTYLVFGRDGVQCGGMYKPSGSTSAPHWLSYIEVANVDTLVTHARGAGGDVVTGPIDVPGGSRIAQLRDSAGVLFAVVATHKTVAAEPKVPSKPSAPAKAKARTSTAALAPATSRALSSPAAKRSTARQPAVRRGASHSTAASKTAAKKVATRAASRKTAAKKTAAKKATARKAGAKRVQRSSRSSSPRRRAGSAVARRVAKQRKSAAKSGRAKRAGAAKGARRAAHSTRRGAGRTGRRKK